MLTHPYVLELLRLWKLSDDQNVQKDLLVLLLHKNNKMKIEELYGILYKYKKSNKKKEDNIIYIKTLLEEYFNCDNGCYILKNRDNLTSETIKMINKGKSTHPKIEYLKLCYENLEIYNNEIAVKLIYKPMKHLKDTEINTNKLLETITKICTKQKKTNQKRESIADSSILTYVTKREKLSVQSSRFIPLQFDSSVYVYTLNNPNFTSLRRRTDLISPTKKIFIKLASDFRPCIYKIPEIQIKLRNSLKCLEGIDYEEDSSWEDGDEGEDIVSEENETDDEISSENEWVEEDYNEDLQKPHKKPQLIFPVIKCLKNPNYDPLWLNLPLRKQDTIQDDNIREIISLKKKDLKELSNIFMIKEEVLKRFLETKPSLR